MSKEPPPMLKPGMLRTWVRMPAALNFLKRWRSPVMMSRCE